ncbi:MAG: hypothetical protein DRP79_07315, partial [Planctomycetota bacterium]
RIRAGSGKELTYRLPHAPVQIGRSPSCQIRLADERVSRHHAQIEPVPEGYLLTDLGSGNGTFVNGKKVTEQRLRIGDRIQVGETLISVLEDTVRAETGGLLGRTIGGYRLEKRIGRGGMGTVYKATQLSLARPVALKILSEDLASNRSFTTMFINEARAAARLSHPNVVLAYDVGKDQDKFFFAMEYVPGGSVQELLAKEKQLPVDRAVRFVIEAAKGLEYAERRGIVHRDIKPDNLMITDDGGIKICDLGLAKRYGVAEQSTGREGICGSPHYIAPEQARGKQVDHRADIYSLGATFYRMLAGVTPFTGGSVKELIKKHITDDPRPIGELRPDVPDSIARVIQRMMARDPAQRYQSATEVISDLSSLQAFGYELELEAESPSSETPELVVPENVASSREEAEEPLLLEEEPPEIEEAPPRIAPPILKAPKPPPRPRKKIPWKKVRRVAGIAGLLLGLAAVLALIVFAIKSVRHKPWLEDLLRAREMAFTDIRGAVDICKKVQSRYADTEEAQTDARKTLKELKGILIKRAEDAGTADMYELLVELFPNDREAVAAAKRGKERIERRARLREAEDDLRKMLSGAEAFEARNRAEVLTKAAEIQAKFRAVLEKKNERYKELSSPAMEKTLSDAREKVEEYKDLIGALEQKGDFEAMGEVIKGALKSRQYAQARNHLEATKNQFPLLVKYFGLPVSEEDIEGKAENEYYSEVRGRIMAELNKADYDEKRKMYDTFADIYKTMNGFLARYGEGKLKDNIESLAAQMKELQRIRREVQDLVERGEYDAAAEVLRNLPRAVSHHELKRLVNRAMATLETAQLDAERRQLISKFERLKRQVEDLGNSLQVTAALNKLDEFEKDNDIIKEIEKDYEALREEIRGLHDFLEAIARSVNAAMSWRPVTLPVWKKAIERIDADSIKLAGLANDLKWSDLLREDVNTDLSFLFEYAADNLRNDSEKLGAAALCLKCGESIKTLKLGYDAMSDLASTLPSRYGDRLEPYVGKLLGKVISLENRMKEKYFRLLKEGHEDKELHDRIIATGKFRDEIKDKLEALQEDKH